MTIDLNDKNIVNEIISEYNLKIYQDDRFFKYGQDSVQLTRFMYLCEGIDNKENLKYIDLCSGTGIVGLIAQRIFNFNKVYFLEKQEYFANLNKLNAKINLDIPSKFSVLNLDINKLDKRKLKELELFGTFDIISVNPPYKKNNSGIDSVNEEKTIAKKEEENFLEKLFEVSSNLLKDKGRLYMVHRFNRIQDLLYECRKYNLEAKTIKVLTNSNYMPKLVLIQFIKNAGEFLKVLKSEKLGN